MLRKLDLMAARSTRATVGRIIDYDRTVGKLVTWYIGSYQLTHLLIYPFQVVPVARFSKRVNSLMNASLTTPVGPLRCLPMMISATPSPSAGAWFLSAYMSPR